MGPGELRAVAVHRVVGLADIARVMKERDHDAHHGALGAEALFDRVRAIVAREQPCHRQRVVEAVLQDVIDRVAAQVAREMPVEEALEVGEGRLEALDLAAWPGLRVQLLDRPFYRRHGTHLHGVGDVVVTASVLHSFLFLFDCWCHCSDWESSQTPMEHQNKICGHRLISTYMSNTASTGAWSEGRSIARGDLSM